MSSFGLSMKYENYDLLLQYWIRRLHRYLCKHRYATGDAKCSAKPLSKISTFIFTAVKTGLQKYHDTCFGRSDVKSNMDIKKLKRIAFKF